jgi:hypothetical protein
LSFDDLLTADVTICWAFYRRIDAMRTWWWRLSVTCHGTVKKLAKIIFVIFVFFSPSAVALLKTTPGEDSGSECDIKLVANGTGFAVNRNNGSVNRVGAVVSDSMDVIKHKFWDLS